MTWRAHAVPRYEPNGQHGIGVGIYLVRTLAPGRLQIVEPTRLTYQTIDHDEAASIDQPPSLVIPDEIAHVTLDALAGHYGGTGDMRTLREDYMHERGRVDNLIKHLTRGGQ